MDINMAQLFAALISTPSVPLYALECAIILRHWNRNFNTSFFRLFLFSAFNNLILNFLFYLPFNRLSELGIFVDFYQRQLPKWIPKFYFCDSLFTFHLENFITLLIMAHRLSAIIWPLDFEQFWHSGLPISLIFCIFGSLALTSPIFSLEVDFFIDQKLTEFRRLIVGYNYDPKKPVFNAYKLLFICSIVFLAASSLLNLAIILAYKWHRTKRARGRDGAAGQRFQQTLEFRLYVYTIGMFLGQLLHCAYYIFAYLYSLFPKQLAGAWRIVVNQYVWLNDLRVLVFPAWFLFWASSEVSAQIHALLGPRLAAIKNGISGTGEWIARIIRRRRENRRRRNSTNPLFIVRFSKGRRWTHPLVIPPNLN